MTSPAAGTRVVPFFFLTVTVNSTVIRTLVSVSVYLRWVYTLEKTRLGQQAGLSSALRGNAKQFSTMAIPSHPRSSSSTLNFKLTPSIVIIRHSGLYDLSRESPLLECHKVNTQGEKWWREGQGSSPRTKSFLAKCLCSFLQRLSFLL